VRRLLILGLLLLAQAVFGQSTLVTAHILDPNGRPYSNSTVTANFHNPDTKIANWSGSPMTATTWQGNTDSFANITLTLPDLNFIGPAVGTYYTFTVSFNTVPGVHPPAPGQPGIPTFTYTSPACPTVGCITGASINISAALQAVAAPLPQLPLPPYGLGTEAVTTNLGLPYPMVNDCAIWLANGILGDLGTGCGGGGGGTPGGAATQYQYNNAGAFGGTSFTHYSPTATSTTAAGDTEIAIQSGIRYVTSDFNWIQSPTGSITVGSNSVTLSPCPRGVDNSFPNYFVDIKGTGTPEAVPVASITACVANAETITFTAAFTHSAGFTIGSASQGTQEAIQDAAGTIATPRNIEVVLPCATGLDAAVQWDATVELHVNHVRLEGNFCARVQCNGRLQCLVMGDHSRTYFIQSVHGIRFVPAYVGTAPQINLVQTASITGCPGSCLATITFTGTHDIKVGDWVQIGGNLNNNQYAGTWKVASVPAANQIAFPGGATNSTDTPSPGGFAVVDYVAIEDGLLDHGEVADVTIQNGGANNLFHYGIVDLSDQHLVLYNFHNEGSGNVIRAGTTEWAGALLYAPGPVNPNGGIAEIYGLDCTIQNSGNCIDWYGSGDDLFVTDSILQGYTQFGIRFGHRRGGFGTLSLKGVHFEIGAASNPFGAIGSAGIINQGATVLNDGLAPVGNVPLLAQTGNQALFWAYYVIPVSLTSDTMCTTVPLDDRCSTTGGGMINNGVGPMLLLGTALVDSGGSPAPVTVTWPPVRGATSYKLLRATQPINSGTTAATAPYGTGNFLIANNINPLTACTDNICTLVDSVGVTPSSIAVPAYTQGSYFPFLDFWPGGVVMSSNIDGSGQSHIPVISYTGPTPLGGVVSTEIPGQDAVFTTTSVTPGILSPFLFQSLQQQPNAGSVQAGFAHLWPAKIGLGIGDGGNWTNIKGVINFGTPVAYTAPFDIVTWKDSNYVKTLATSLHRPTNDVGDTATGIDANGLYVRDPAQITEYINHLPDGVNWITRLTASGPQSKAVTFATLAACASALEGTMRAVTDSTTAVWGATITGGGTNHVLAYCDSSAWTVAAK